MQPIYLWQWSSNAGAIRWSSFEQGQTTETRKPANLSIMDPLVEPEPGVPYRLSELARRSSGTDASFRGVIAECTQHPELRGAGIVGFGSGDVASGAVFQGSQVEVSPLSALSASLIEGIEALPEAFVLYDDRDRMIICNEQYRRLYPAVADMMMPGMHFPELVHESVKRGVFQIDEDREIWAERRISFHQAGIGFFEQHLAEGRWIQVSERRTASGGTTSIRADITVLKERERDLRAARAKAEADTAARTAFIAKVGHELRNPLNVIFGIAQLLAGETLSKPHRAMIENLLGASRAMRDVLNDILDVTEFQAGHVTIRREATVCRPLLQEVVNIARTMAEQKGLAFRVRLATDMPERILTDPRRLRQILFNLLGNAVKYTPAGTIAITASVRRPSQEAPVLRIAVTDSGSGIAPGLMAKILAPYARQREHVTAGVEGLGLGLAISHELAQAIGARLGIAPAPGGGTRAWIDLPIASDDDLRRIWPAAPQRPRIAPGPPLDILVVDDEPTNLIVADALLTRLGHQVTTARDGAAGLVALRDRRFHAVLLDIAMPDMSGIEMARSLSGTDAAGDRLAIIAMTGNVMPQDIKAYLAAGFTGFVEKPVELDDLVEALAVARHDGAGNGVLQPGDRLRFPRADATRAFDRTPLDRMVSDIGHGSVASIVATGIATFRQTSAALDEAPGERLGLLLHKVHAVAALLGLDELAARTALREERAAHSLTRRQRAELRDCLGKAMAQMESYALDLDLTGPSD